MLNSHAELVSASGLHQHLLFFEPLALAVFLTQCVRALFQLVSVTLVGISFFIFSE